MQFDSLNLIGAVIIALIHLTSGSASGIISLTHP